MQIVESVQIRAYNVPYKDKIPRLLAVPENDRAVPPQEPVDENGHHSGFTVRILAGAIHVGVPQHHRTHLMNRLVVMEIVLYGQLGHAIGTEGVCRMRLWGGIEYLVSINRPPCGSEDNALDPVSARALEQIQGPEDVGIGIMPGMGHGPAKVDVRSLVIDEVEVALLKDGVEGRAADVILEKLRPRVQVDHLTRRKAVYNSHVVPCPEICIDDMGSNKPRAATDQNI